MYKNMSGMQKDEADDRILVKWLDDVGQRCIAVFIVSSLEKMRLNTGVYLNVINNPPTS